LAALDVSPLSPRSYTPPQTQLEKLLADTWKEVLKIDRVGIHDSFFELGGNSLGVIRVNGKLREALNRDISVVAMYRYFTIHRFAAYLNHHHQQQQRFEQEADRQEALGQGKRRLQQSFKRRTL
jgi:pyochelin synthetase